MNQDQRRQLDGILDAAASRARPRLDYTSMRVKDFLWLWTYMRAVETFSLMLVEAGSCRNQDGFADAKREEIRQLLEPPFTRQDILDPVKQLPVRERLLRVAELYYEPGIFQVLAECEYERPCIVAEISRRRQNHEIATEAVIVPLTTGELGDVSVARSPQTEIPTDFGIDDFKQEVFLRVWKATEKKTGMLAAPLPPYPLPLRRDMREIWDTHMRQVWEQEQRSLGKIATAWTLDGQVLRDDLRRLFETETRGARRRRALLRKRKTDIHNTYEENQLDQNLSNKRAKEDLVLTARARWGEKAAKAVEYVVIHDKKEKDAALLADVPYGSLRRYISKLYKQFNRHR